MTKLIIFGGTSEGRKLAEFCAERRIPAAVSVATEYGASLLPAGSLLEIHTGPMDLAAMEKWLDAQAPSLVLDATHPYAAQVTENIREACRRKNLPLLRVLRGEAPRAGSLKAEAAGDPAVVTVDTVSQAAEFLKNRPENVLVTTGSKELGAFMALENWKERVFARVLPVFSVLAGCEKMGFPGSHIFALQGPFSAEMNLAMLKMAGAAWLVTKEAGRAGGFEEKLEAARAAGAGVVVVGRPRKEEGISLEEAFERLKKLEDGSGAKEEAVSAPEPVPSRLLVLAGAGMGTVESMTVEAVEALLRCQAVFGAPRMLQAAGEVFARFGGERRPEMLAEYLPGPVFQWLEAHPECGRAAVLFSGDTGFYSGTAGFLREVGKGKNWEIQILPGISSLSRMAAALGKSWEDAAIASRHGRDWDVRGLAEKSRKVFVLTGGDCRAEQICRELSGLPVTVSVGENLGTGRERIVTGTPEELAGEQFASLAVVWIEEDEQ